MLSKSDIHFPAPKPFLELSVQCTHSAFPLFPLEEIRNISPPPPAGKLAGETNGRSAFLEIFQEFFCPPLALLRFLSRQNGTKGVRATPSSFCSPFSLSLSAQLSGWHCPLCSKEEERRKEEERKKRASSFVYKGESVVGLFRSLAFLPVASSVPKSPSSVVVVPPLSSLSESLAAVRTRICLRFLFFSPPRFLCVCVNVLCSSLLCALEEGGRGRNKKISSSSSHVQSTTPSSILLRGWKWNRSLFGCCCSWRKRERKGGNDRCSPK